MHFHKAISIKTFRYLCLLTAVANAGGNLGMLLFYKPIYNLVGAPLPKDLFSFAFVCGFSFTVGVLAFMVFLAPEKTTPLLVVGIVGKAIYAFFTFFLPACGHQCRTGSAPLPHIVVDTRCDFFGLVFCERRTGQRQP